MRRVRFNNTPLRTARRKCRGTPHQPERTNGERDCACRRCSEQARDLKARSVFTFAVTYRRSLTKLRAAHRGNHVVRAQLIALLAAQHPELSTRESEIILNAFFEGITEHLVKGGRVEIRGFGSFSTRDRAAHTGRNPRSGELVEVDARRALHFTPGKNCESSSLTRKFDGTLGLPALNGTPPLPKSF